MNHDIWYQNICNINYQICGSCQLTAGLCPGNLLKNTDHVHGTEELPAMLSEFYNR